MNQPEKLPAPERTLAEVIAEIEQYLADRNGMVVGYSITMRVEHSAVNSVVNLKWGNLRVEGLGK